MTGSILLDDIVERLGWDDMIAFIGSHAGQAVFFPATMGDDHPYVQSLGRARAERFASNFSNQVMEVPVEFAREYEVLTMAAQNPRPKINDIVAATKLTYRDVRRILQGKPTITSRALRKRFFTSAQPDLFDQSSAS